MDSLVSRVPVGIRRTAQQSLSLLLLATLSCGQSPWHADVMQQVVEEHQSVTIEGVGEYTAFELKQLFRAAGLPGEYNISRDIALYRVLYAAEDFEGREVPVSGLVALPVRGSIRGVLGWNHGTQTDRDFSISSLEESKEGLLLAGAAAGDGFLLLAPDYIGLGVSTEVQPYYHVPTTVGPIVGLLQIGESILRVSGLAEDNDLYLAGHSQGAAASAAVHRALESDNPTSFRVRGSAGAAGAYDLRNVAIRYGLSTRAKYIMEYWGLLLNCYSHTYGHSLEGILQSPYAEQIDDWFDGEHKWEFLNSHLPKYQEDFFTKQFIDDFYAGREEPQWFYDALEENETHDWSPKAPFRFYYGTRDADVDSRNSIEVYNHMKLLGGNVSLVNTGPEDHEGTILNAMPNFFSWINELETDSR